AAVVILRDVTEERLMQERLLQSEKMVSVGQLVSGVAHEINNPLTGIMGFAQLILLRDLDEQTKSEVNTILTEADRAAKIVQNLLSFARRKRAEKELANLNVLLERVLELRTYELRVKNIEIEMDLDPALPDTMVDATQIQQVMFNIINNAEHAIVGSTDQGVLKVRTSHEKDAIRLSFQDNGAGMSAETVRRIFDPFFTTKETGEGTGLGLALAYGIVRSHGGFIEVKSDLGQGTRFDLYFPPTQESARIGPSVVEQKSVVGHGELVLLVDDEPVVRDVAETVLEQLGYRVIAAPGGHEALEIYKERGADIDLVLLDLMMPRMRGEKVFSELRKMNPQVCIVISTGNPELIDRFPDLANYASGFAHKPYRVNDLGSALKAALAEQDS
ncbi:MAG: response regulator, partial [Proteobacteria bacterium]|nr:response regulator [Pseudomonadota bacterium]